MDENCDFKPLPLYVVIILSVVAFFIILFCFLQFLTFKTKSERLYVINRRLSMPKPPPKPQPVYIDSGVNKNNEKKKFIKTPIAVIKQDD